MMPWWGFAATLLGVYLLQTAVVGYFDSTWLDLFLTTAVLIALLMPLYDARLAAWLTGFVQDLGSGGPVGVHAFTLGLAAVLLTSWRGRVNINLWWVRAMVGTAAAYPAVFLNYLHLHYWQGNYALSVWAIGAWAFVPALTAALLAAAISGLPWLVVARRRSARYRIAR